MVTSTKLLTKKEKKRIQKQGNEKLQNWVNVTSSGIFFPHQMVLRNVYLISKVKYKIYLKKSITGIVINFMVRN